MPSPLPEDQKMKRVNIWLPLELLDYLEEQVEIYNQMKPYNKTTQSAYIRNLLALERLQNEN